MVRKCLWLGGLLAVTALAQSNPASKAAREWRSQHERVIVDEFVSLLSIPNVASDRVNIQRNAELIVQMMQRRGINAKLVSIPGANPIVFGELATPGASRTIGFYAHYDGSPVNPEQWASPPFKPTLRDRPVEQDGRAVPFPPSGVRFDPESRLYARSSADDKAPIVCIFAALDALRAAGLKAKSNLKFAFEGEEEALSINLEKVITANRELFSADLWLMCDAPTHQSRRQQIHFGARGVTSLDITVYGPRSELHSGHYGNCAPNPALMLVRLLASMKGNDGHVLVDHFYDGIEPLNETEKGALAEVPDIDGQLMQDFWLGSTEGAPRKFAELITMPALNIRGISSGRVGNLAASVIPASAEASVIVYLVKGMDHRRTAALLVEHIRKQGFFVVDTEPGADVQMGHAQVAKVVVRPGGYNAVRTSMDLPISQEVIRTVESARGPSVKLPNMGGGVPLEMIERPLNTHTIGIPIGNHDNNQHSSNENLRLQNLWDGIELMAALLAM